MWINRDLFDSVMHDHAVVRDENVALHVCSAVTDAQLALAKEQKAKDDLHIDWLRHRVNALEKQNIQLLGKVTGIAFPVPEIVMSRAGAMTLPPDFDTMPSFEDVGDSEAARLGLSLDENGQLLYSGKS